MSSYFSKVFFSSVLFWKEIHSAFGSTGFTVKWRLSQVNDTILQITSFKHKWEQWKMGVPPNWVPFVGEWEKQKQQEQRQGHGNILRCHVCGSRKKLRLKYPVMFKREIISQAKKKRWRVNFSYKTDELHDVRTRM